MRVSDFQRALGHEAKIELTQPHATAASVFAALISGVEGEGRDAILMLERTDARSDEEKTVRLPLRDLDEGKLVLTEALIRESLRAAKAGRSDGRGERGADAEASRTSVRAADRAVSRAKARQKPKPLVPAGVQTRFKEGKRIQFFARLRPARRIVRSPQGDETMAVSANRLELLQIADAVAREKSIDRSIVIASMEDALQKAARSRYGQETEVRAEINPRTGEVRFSRLMLVVDEVDNDADADSRWPMRASAIRRRRPATGFPKRCRRSTSAASPRNRPSRSSCRRCARPSATASMRNSRTASARSSTASSSASNTAMSSSTSAAARRSFAATR